ncbi:MULTISPECIES: hypothetical protein [unclassified Mesorhizobium]|uniref:hypothetical protein n=1 Tax=unclassified Mesorhizobium TaxID=325217 RepID=UPI001AEC970D|nr:MULTISPECIES: hypothetical protein [unclassified Mesorhizobium]
MKGFDIAAAKIRALSFMAVSQAFSAAAHTPTGWCLATKQPDSSEGKTHKVFAEQVEEYSGGDLIVTVHPSEQLHKENAIGLECARCDRDFPGRLRLPFLSSTTAAS